MSREEFFAPPAAHQEYEQCYAAIMKRAGALNEEVRRGDRQNLQKFLEMGRLLTRARPMAEDDWEQTLAEAGISHQRASDARWGADQPSDEQDKWESVADLRRARAEQSIPRSSDMAQKGHVPPEESTNPPGLCCRPCRVSGKTGPTPGCKGCEAVNEADEATVEPVLKCPECRARGEWRVGCAQCYLLNKPPTRHREPGEDDGELDAMAEINEREAARVPFADGTTPAGRAKGVCPECGRSF